MKDVTITLADGTKVSGTVTAAGEVWSPLGRALAPDMIADTKPADLDGHDNQLSDGYEAWSRRVQRMGRKVQAEADQLHSTTRRLASGARWIS